MYSRHYVVYIIINKPQISNKNFSGSGCSVFGKRQFKRKTLLSFKEKTIIYMYKHITIAEGSKTVVVRC